MEKPAKRPRKSLPVKRPFRSKEVRDHKIPYIILKEDTRDIITIKCSYCCKVFDNIELHQEHDCKKIHDFLLKCVSCSTPYVDHRVNNKKFLVSNQEEENNSSAETRTSDSLKFFFRCCVCMRLFSDLLVTSRHIKYHMTRNATEPTLHCGQCDKAFVTKQQLMKHETVHSNLRPFKCDECDKWFKTPDNVKRHMFVHNEARPFPCPTCGKEFKARHMLKKHEETHNDQRLYECPKCDKKYKASNSLRDHLRVHSGYRPFKCQQCDQAFYRPSHLRTHKVVHSKVKPFACKDCEKKFGRREHLKVHERIHSGEKPFKCTLCERSFNQQAGLQAHLVSHSEERPHPCLKCNKSFKYPSQIKHHACKPEIGPSMVHGEMVGGEGASQKVYMDPSLPEELPNMTDCGNGENAPVPDNSTSCLNPANTIILIQIHNTPEVPLLNADTTGTQQLMRDMQGQHEIHEAINENILDHDGNAALEQGRLSVNDDDMDGDEPSGMVVGIEDLVNQELLEKI